MIFGIFSSLAIIQLMKIMLDALFGSTYCLSVFWRLFLAVLLIVIVAFPCHIQVFFRNPQNQITNPTF